MKIKSISDVKRAITLKLLPISAAQDVQGRILDHILSGGNIEDPYIKQQYRYAEKVARDIKKTEFTQRTLDKLLDKIVDEYFSEVTQENGLGMWEVIEYVKEKYTDKIATLPK